MLFNSIQFLIYLPVVFCLYWFVFGKSLWWQNLFVVAASYLFYGWWDWRFLILIAFTSLWAWAFGVMDLRWTRGRKARMVLSLVINLGILGVFKYYNFFLDQAVAVLNALGFQAHPPVLRIILPVGISFYTFQALSYTIDVYRKTIEPTRDPVAFFAYVSFFPQLVAGPIERATNLLPQFLKPRTFDYPQAVDGCRQMLWGFFKKMVVADNCAIIANWILNGDVAKPLSGIALWVAMFCFTIQIYGDFSGYSDIAIGCSRLFGIQLKQNFNLPYFSRDIAEFWRRWHISLTTWFRDYLYIPLGGSRCSKWKQIRNTFAIFLVSGFWHGANWTFILWGFFHALCFLPLLLFGKNRKYLNTIAEGRIFPTFGESWRMALTFFVVVLCWTFFRAPNASSAFHWLAEMATLGGGLSFKGFGIGGLAYVVPWIFAMLSAEWLCRSLQHPLQRMPSSRFVRWCLYLLIGVIIGCFSGRQQTFIYFQF